MRAAKRAWRVGLRRGALACLVTLRRATRHRAGRSWSHIDFARSAVSPHISHRLSACIRPPQNAHANEVPAETLGDSGRRRSDGVPRGDPLSSLHNVFVDAERPVPGIPTVRLMPFRPIVTLDPRGPKLRLGPDFDRFRVTPGRIRARRQNRSRQAMPCSMCPPVDPAGTADDVA